MKNSDEATVPPQILARRRKNRPGPWARMRSWPQEQGMTVADRGPLPDAVVIAYAKAHPGEILPAVAAPVEDAAEQVSA
jgi:hypothetical protein